MVVYNNIRLTSMYGNINIIFIAQNKSYCLTNGYDFTLSFIAGYGVFGFVDNFTLWVVV